MSFRTPKFSYWQDAPMPRDQLVLFAATLEERIPQDHPVRLLDEILDALDWTKWEAVYEGKLGQPPIHPSILCKVLLFALSRKIRADANRFRTYKVESVSKLIEELDGQITHAISQGWD
ncbi:transposase [Pirellulaceae bacterium SH449]